MTEDHSKHSGCAWPDEPCNQLTFAEAMALNVGEVEVHELVNGYWRPLVELDGCAFIGSVRMAKFRRRLVRQKMSRVRKIGGESEMCVLAASTAVRDVCEWLRDRMFDGNDDTNGNDIAIALEREFLEPR